MAKQAKEPFTKEDIQMTNRHLKRCSTSCCQRTENQNNEIVLHIYWNGKKSQMLARIQSNKNSHSLLVGMQNFTAAFKDNLAVSNKLNILLPYNLAIIHLCTYANELKTYGHTKAYIKMCTATLFKITENQNGTQMLINRK